MKGTEENTRKQNRYSLCVAAYAAVEEMLLCSNTPRQGRSKEVGSEVIGVSVVEEKIQLIN